MSTENTSSEREQRMTSDEYQAALTAARQENEALQDKYLRAAAAVEKVRKQAERDAEQRLRQRLGNFSRRLLEVADNLERALAHASEGDPLHPGVQATLSQLQTFLGQEGVTPIAVEPGATFDPQLHEAIAAHPADVDQATVAEVTQTGYLFNGQVLRPVRVVVTVPVGDREER